MAYVYRITHKETGRFYIGFSKGAKRIGIDYFTSSLHTGYTPETVGEWTTEIIREGDGEECWRLEQDMIREAADNPLIINRHYCPEGAKIPVYFKPHTEEHNRHKSETTTDRWQNDEQYRQNHIEGARKRWANDDAGRRRVSEANKKQWQDPEYRERMPKIMSENAKEIWERPGYKESRRADQIAAAKARWAKPGARERHREALKKARERKNNS